MNQVKAGTKKAFVNIALLIFLSKGAYTENGQVFIPFYKHRTLTIRNHSPTNPTTNRLQIKRVRPRAATWQDAAKC